MRSDKTTGGDGKIRLEILVWACLLNFLALPVPGGLAETGETHTVTITADRQIAYADRLFAEGDYPCAVVEYRRFIHFFPDDGRVDTAHLRMGQCHFRLGAYPEAIRAFDRLTDRYSRKDPARSEAAVSAYWMISVCHSRLGDAGAAVLNLRNLLALTDDSRVRDEAWYRIGWLYVASGEWEKARRAFGQIREESRGTFGLDRQAAELSGAGSIPRKKPGLAGLLSVIPGLGQVYCGRYRDALIALLVNGALAAAAVEAFDNGGEVLGGVIGLVELGFYAGNIHGAANSARKHNRNETRRFIERLKTQINIGLGPAPEDPGIVLKVCHPF